VGAGGRSWPAEERAAQSQDLLAPAGAMEDSHLQQEPPQSEALDAGQRAATGSPQLERASRDGRRRGRRGAQLREEGRAEQALRFREISQSDERFGPQEPRLFVPT